MDFWLVISLFDACAGELPRPPSLVSRGDRIIPATPGHFSGFLLQWILAEILICDHSVPLSTSLVAAVAALPRYDCRYSSGRRSFCASSHGAFMAEVVMSELKLQNHFATEGSRAHAWHVHMLAYMSISIPYLLPCSGKYKVLG